MSISNETRKILAELFLNIAEHELNVENGRLDLAEQYSFESIVGFNRIDLENSGEIEAEDIKLFCDDNAIKCTLSEAARLIDQYDENGNGRLSYIEFCQLILPSTNDHLRAIAKSREAEYRFIKSAYLSVPVENALANLFRAEIEYQRAIEDIKIELNQRSDFSTKRCFDAIDKAHPYNSLDRNEIRDFVGEYYTILSEDDLDAIIRRCDTDEDEQISYQEFIDVAERTQVNPVIRKFATSFGRSSTIRKSPTERVSWRDLYSSYDDRGSRYTNSRHRTLLNQPNKYRFPEEYSSYYGPERLSWKHLNSSYRTYLRNSKYHNGDLVYDPYEDGAYRYSTLAPTESRRTYIRRSSRSRSKLDNIEDEDSLERVDEPINRKTRTNFRTLSHSIIKNPRSSNRKRLTTSNPWRYSFHDVARTKVVRSPERRSLTRGGYTSTKKNLRDEFDVAEELGEERKTAIKDIRNSSSKKTIRTAHTLRSSEEDQFVESLRDLVTLDKELERAKQALALKTDFTLHDGFRVFDCRDRGEADLDDILDAFNLFKINPDVEEARLFLARYDVNKNNKLSFDEFCDAFIPLHQGTADILKERSEEFPSGYYRRRDEFSNSTIDAFTRVLELHLEVEMNAEVLRQKHEESPYFRYDSAFSTLNKWGDDFVTGKDFKEIFQKYGFDPTNEEMDILLDRFDKDKDGRVSYNEFFDEFAPHSPVKV